MLVDEILPEADSREHLLGRIFGDVPRFLVLPRLLKIGTFRRTFESDLPLFTAALRTDAIVKSQAEALFFSQIADRAGQPEHLGGRGGESPNSLIMASPCILGRENPHGRCLFERPCGKNRIKYGKNALHGNEVVIGYAQVEQSLLTLSRRITNGNRHDQDPAGPSHGREERVEQQAGSGVPRSAG